MSPDLPDSPDNIPDSKEFLVLAAQITGAHGVTGNVRLRLIGENALLTAQSLQGSGKVWVAPPSGNGDGRFLTLRSLRKQTQPKGAWIAQWREITHRVDAEALYGWEIRIKEGARATLPPGEYYVDDLLGMALQTDTGAALGTLTDVLHSPANDVYETDTGVLVPAVPEFIVLVDRDAGTITVRDVPGLRD